GQKQAHKQEGSESWGRACDHERELPTKETTAKRPLTLSAASHRANLHFAICNSHFAMLLSKKPEVCPVTILSARAPRPAAPSHPWEMSHGERGPHSRRPTAQGRLICCNQSTSATPTLARRQPGPRAGNKSGRLPAAPGRSMSLR